MDIDDDTLSTHVLRKSIDETEKDEIYMSNKVSTKSFYTYFIFYTVPLLNRFWYHEII